MFSDGVGWEQEARIDDGFILTRQANYYNHPSRQMQELEDTIRKLESIYFSNAPCQSIEHVDKELLIPFPNDIQAHRIDIKKWQKNE